MLVLLIAQILLFPTYPHPCNNGLKILSFGDSHTVMSATAKNDNEAFWQIELIHQLGCAINFNVPIGAVGYGTGWLATNGATTALRKSTIDTDLATITAIPNVVLYSLGSNDAFFGQATPAGETAYKTNMAYILDAMHRKWPQTIVIYSDSWRQGYDTECDRIKGWSADVVAGRSYVSHCDDMTVWAKGADDGDTMFWEDPPRLHLSYAGVLMKAQLVRACLGF